MRAVAKESGRTPLADDERDGIILAVNSAFRKLKNLYTKVVPIFESYGFTPPSAGVIARDLSEKIEASIIQHRDSFTEGNGHCDLCRFEADWEVKICKDSGLTINQSKVVNGENYIVVNYRANSIVKSIWILWDAQDRFFSPRLGNSNARSINRAEAQSHIELIFDSNETIESSRGQSRSRIRRSSPSAAHDRRDRAFGARSISASTSSPTRSTSSATSVMISTAKR